MVEILANLDTRYFNFTPLFLDFLEIIHRREKMWSNVGRIVPEWQNVHEISLK